MVLSVVESSVVEEEVGESVVDEDVDADVEPSEVEGSVEVEAGPVEVEAGPLDDPSGVPLELDPSSVSPSTELENDEHPGADAPSATTDRMDKTRAEQPISGSYRIS